VATSGGGQVVSDERSFTTRSDVPPSPAAYELVSPPEKGGHDITAGRNIPEGPLSSSAGSWVAYQSRGASDGSASNTMSNIYIATRAQDSWTSRPISPPVDPSPSLNPRVLQLAQDHSSAVVSSNAALAPGGWSSSVPFFGEALYRRSFAPDSYETLTPPPAAGGAGGFTGPTPYQTFFAGADAKLKHIIFETSAELTPDAVPLPDFNRKLYKWSNGTLELESILPDGTPTVGSAGSAAQLNELFVNPVSEDGSRVFFTAIGGAQNGALFVRRGGATTLIAPSAVFRGATPDGRYAFFTAGGSLHRYDVDEATSTLISADDEPDDGPADIEGVAGFSEDGSRVYFAASGGEIVDGADSADSSPRLYVWDSGVLKLVSRLRSDELNFIAGPTASSPNRYVTPSGGAVLFSSRANLTGYDNSSPGCLGGSCRELFFYDVTQSTPTVPDLVCVSCDPDGDAPTGDAGNVQGSSRGLEPRSRHVSNDGEKVFFTSPDRLISGDQNREADVYKWEADSLDLISTGRSSEDSSFTDASATGTDVFFTTVERLVGWDQDNSADLYDSRVGGGLPEPPDATPTCEGDECQGAGQQAPQLAEPVTGAFEGGGNARPRRPRIFTVLRSTRAARDQFARSGRLPLRVRVRQSGRISVVAVARVAGRRRVVGRAARRTTRRGVVVLPVKVSRRARRHLAAVGVLRLTLRVRFSRVLEPTTVSVTLRDETLRERAASVEVKGRSRRD
jgi:hypothetical protein